MVLRETQATVRTSPDMHRDANVELGQKNIGAMRHSRNAMWFLIFLRVQAHR